MAAVPYREIFYIISNGVRFTGMPAFGREDSAESIWDLVAFIRHLPQLSPEELKQMQQLAGEQAEEEGGQEADDENRENKSDYSGDEKGIHHKPSHAQPHTHGPGTKPHAH